MNLSLIFKASAAVLFINGLMALFMTDQFMSIKTSNSTYGHEFQHTTRDMTSDNTLMTTTFDDKLTTTTSDDKLTATASDDTFTTTTDTQRCIVTSDQDFTIG